MMVTCSKCGVGYPMKEGYFYARSGGEFMSPCKTCIKGASAARYAANHADINLQRRLRLSADLEAKEKKRLSDAASYQRHRDARLDWQRDYRSRPDVATASSAYFRALREREGFVEEKKAYLREYHKRLRANPVTLALMRQKGRQYWRDNPEKARATVRNRRARLRGASGTHCAADIQRQLRRQRYKCYYCKCSIKNGYTVDHYIPLARGGGNGPTNLVMACGPCNYSKGAKLPSEFMAIRHNGNQKGESHGI